MKASNEAEAACQQRLSAAETEIAELRSNLDSAERFVLPVIFILNLLKNVTSHWLSNGVHGANAFPIHSLSKEWFSVFFFSSVVEARILS